jgi:hypothetical protein
MALYGRDANGIDAYIRGSGSGVAEDGYLTFHDVFSDDIKFTSSNITASADLITAVASTKFRVISVVLSADAACTLQFRSDATTAIAGALYLAANQQTEMSNSLGLFETAAGEKLDIAVTGAANIGVTLSYREVT